MLFRSMLEGGGSHLLLGFHKAHVLAPLPFGKLGDGVGGTPLLDVYKRQREDPSIINPKRKRRIAAGSGTQVSDVNKLLKQFEMMQKMMKQFKKSPKGFARRLGGLMGNPNAFKGLK